MTHLLRGRRQLAAVLRLALAALSLAVASGCATTRAETPRERPALDVPVPPPREIAPLPLPETPAPMPVGDLPPGTGAPSPSRPRPVRERETAKPEAKPEEAKPAEALPPPAAPAPVPELRIPASADSAQLAGQIREAVVRSRRLLENIDYGPLSNARKKAYDDAKMFALQAEEALKANNLVFAQELAEKAERLAKELQTRLSSSVK